LAGDGRWKTIISSSAALAGSQTCMTRFMSAFPDSSLSSALSATESLWSIGHSFSLPPPSSLMLAWMICRMGW